MLKVSVALRKQTNIKWICISWFVTKKVADFFFNKAAFKAELFPTKFYDVHCRGLRGRDEMMSKCTATAILNRIKPF